MKICICDDDANIHSRLEQLIENFMTAPVSLEVLKTSSGEELLELFGSSKPDIIFLDIEMSGISGILTAEKIREINKNTIIIFVSSHSDYVFDTFRLDALHFMRKPIQDYEFTEVFTRAMQKYKTLNSTITLRWQGERYSVPIDTVTHAEGYNRHVMLHAGKDRYEAVGRLRDIFPILEPHGFIYVHQGYIVNMNYIRHFGNEEVLLHNGTRVPVSVRKRQQALRLYDEFIQKRMW